VKGPRVLALVGDSEGCTLWRVWQPFSELSRRGYAAWWRYKDDAELGAPEWPYLAATRLEAVILPRLSWHDQIDAHHFAESVRGAGLRIIYDLDDDLLSPQIEARLQATTQRERSSGQLEQDRRDRIAAIRLCDGVTCSSDYLADLVRQYVDVPVEVIPNALDIAWFKRVLRGASRVVPPLTIGWAGGSRSLDDFTPVVDAWANVARRRPDVRFVIQGFVSPELAAAVPSERLTVLPWMSAAEYPSGLKNIDIACCSVAASHFNRCKTPIKLWEFTLAGAVSVVSPTLYGPVASPHEDALIAETATEWTDALLELIDDCELRRRLWRNQRRRVATEYALDKHVLEWPEAWTRLLAN